MHGLENFVHGNKTRKILPLATAYWAHWIGATSFWAHSKHQFYNQCFLSQTWFQYRQKCCPILGHTAAYPSVQDDESENERTKKKENPFIDFKRGQNWTPGLEVFSHKRFIRWDLPILSDHKSHGHALHTQTQEKEVPWWTREGLYINFLLSIYVVASDSLNPTCLASNDFGSRANARQTQAHLLWSIKGSIH